MAGLKVIPVKTTVKGNLDLQDLKSKAEQYSDRLAALMVCLLFVDFVARPSVVF